MVFEAEQKQNLDMAAYRAISTDSRTIKPGQIFLALKGDNFDGHDYLVDALNAGARLAYSEMPIEELIADNGLRKQYQNSIVKVKDTLETYHQLANEYRSKLDPIVVAITGSAGKTTTKEILRLVLAEQYKVHYSRANFNNEIGLPKTILEMPEDTQVLVLELAMRGLGEIELLSKTCEPNIALITNIGSAHIERLGSRENIKKAKLEILAGLCDDGRLIVDSNLYKELDLKTIKAEVTSFDAEPRFTVEGLMSEGIYADLNAVYKVAKLLGLSDDQFQAGLAKYSPGEGRGKYNYDQAGNIFIDETYNSNPEAVRSSVKALLSQFPNDYKVAVLGDIKECDKSLVDNVFDEVKELEDDCFKLIDARGLIIDDIEKKIKAISNDMRKVYLLKASREVKLETILAVL